MASPRLLAGLCSLVAVPALISAAEPVLMLRSEPSQPIFGAHPTESGGVYAITHVDGQLHVCHQTGSPAPNKVFAQGANDTGNFFPDLPLNPVHATNLTIVRTEGTGTGGHLVVINETGRSAYHLSPANYPALNSPVLAGAWGVALPFPASPGRLVRQNALKFSLSIQFIIDDGDDTTVGVVTGPVIPSGSNPAPFHFADMRPDTVENLLRVSQRLEVFLPFPDRNDMGSFFMTTPRSYIGDPSPSMEGFTIRPVQFQYDFDGGHINGLYLPRENFLTLPADAYGPDVPPGSQLTNVRKVSPFAYKMFLAAGEYNDEVKGAAVVTSNAALVGVAKEPTASIDCEKADLNGDGTVDGKDMDQLLQYSLTGDLRGDLNGDGVVGSDDFEYMHKAIEECDKKLAGQERFDLYNTAGFLISTGQSLPRMPEYKVTNVYGVRANGDGVGVIVVSAAREGASPVKAVLLLDGAGFRPVIMVGDNLGHGTITAIDDSTARRGVSQVNRQGQFTVTVQLEDGTSAVYRIDGSNDAVPRDLTPADVATVVLGYNAPIPLLDINSDGMVDSADAVAVLTQ